MTDCWRLVAPDLRVARPGEVGARNASRPLHLRRRSVTPAHHRSIATTAASSATVPRSENRIGSPTRIESRSVGDADLSTELAEELQRHDPSYAGTRFALAVDAERRGNRMAALREYEYALQRWHSADPDFADLVYARVHAAALRQPR